MSINLINVNTNKGVAEMVSIDSSIYWDPLLGVRIHDIHWLRGVYMDFLLR